jgi:uncharacterized protein (UPF0332 family)
MASLLLPLQELRDTADYDSQFVSKNAAAKQIRNAQEFLKPIFERLQ